MAYEVHSDLFEGPLDLLLFLVSKQKLDITAVCLAQVAGEYWAYLKVLENLDLDVESSYLVVFACLLELKSRVLLPPEPEEEGVTDLEDFDLGDTAEHDLVERLQEYRRYKQASRVLQEREREAMQMYPREFVETDSSIVPEALDVSLPDLLSALRGLLAAHQKRVKERRSLHLERISLSVPERMTDLMHRFDTDRSIEFFELFDEDLSRSFIIVTFLAILELAKMRRLRLRQENNGPIYVQRWLSASESKSGRTAALGAADKPRRQDAGDSPEPGV